MKFTSLDLKVSRGDQSVRFIELLSAPGHKLRVGIKSDAYQFQSYARIERWDGNEWREVASIPYGLMKTKEGLAYLPGGSGAEPAHFAADRAELVRLATLVLG